MKKVSLFIPCIVDQFLPEIGEATAGLLARLGASVAYDPRQTCCGQPLINAGRTKEAKQAALRFIDIFEDGDYVVAPSGSCVHTVKHHYPTLLEGSVNYDRAKRLADRVFELSDFIVNVMKVTDTGATFPGKGPADRPPVKITYHHSCHIIRGLGISAQPRTLLSSVNGIEAIPLMNEDVCCGFGGEFAAMYPDISQAMVEDKVSKIAATGAQYLVLAEPGCILNIRGYLDRKKIPVKVIHLAQLLESGVS